LAGKGARTSAIVIPTLRLDRWLWQARFFRSRVDAVAEITSGHVRINGQKTKKPGHVLRAGDALTFVQADRVRVVRVAALGQRRGPAAEAQELYIDLDPQLPDAASGLLE
jgi:ribosome-associated heat shock protein Hsp15